MSQQKTYRWLLISVAINIFMIAFMLGRAAPPFMQHDGMHGPRGAFGKDGPPPPFIGMHALFSEKEMHDDMPFAKERFDKIHTLRDAFAKRLSTGDVSAKEINSHFSAVDKVMDELKDHMQAKAAAKIEAMSPEERKAFAEKLKKEKDHPPRPPHHEDGPGGDDDRPEKE